jgi:hypothetical protein
MHGRPIRSQILQLQVDRLASLWSASEAAVKSVNEDLVSKCQAIAGLEAELLEVRKALAERDKEVNEHISMVATVKVCCATQRMQNGFAGAVKYAALRYQRPQESRMNLQLQLQIVFTCIF